MRCATESKTTNCRSGSDDEQGFADEVNVEETFNAKRGQNFTDLPSRGASHSCGAAESGSHRGIFGKRPLLLAFAGNLSRRVEPDWNFTTRGTYRSLVSVASGAWPGTGLRLGRVLHPWHRLLFADQDAEHQHVSGAQGLDIVEPLDLWSGSALAGRSDRLALAMDPAGIRDCSNSEDFYSSSWPCVATDRPVENQRNPRGWSW